MIIYSKPDFSGYQINIMDDINDFKSIGSDCSIMVVKKSLIDKIASGTNIKIYTNNDLMVLFILIVIVSILAIIRASVSMHIKLSNKH